MLSKIFAIIGLHFTQTLRNRNGLFQMFVLPLILTFILGQAIGSQSQGSTRWSLAVTNQDQGAFGQRLVTALGSQPQLDVVELSEDAALAQLNAEDNDLYGVLSIPANFSAALTAQQPLTLTYRVATASPETQFVSQAINTAAAKVGGSVQTALVTQRVAQQLKLPGVATEGAAGQAYLEETSQQALARWLSDPPVTVNSSQVTRLNESQNSVPQGLSQTSPGLLVMFALFFIIGGGATLLQERERGTLQRLSVMPISRGTILVGKILAIYISGILQITILILAGVYLFDVAWGQAPLALVAMVLSFALAATSLGIMLAALARTSSQLNALSTIAVLTLSSLGGAWWPLDVVPTWMQQFGHAFPTAWAMDGFNDIITRGLGLQAVALEAGVLLAFALAFFVVAVWRFRYE